jgi:hypothetical protein
LLFFNPVIKVDNFSPRSSRCETAALSIVVMSPSFSPCQSMRTARWSERLPDSRIRVTDGPVASCGYILKKALNKCHFEQAREIYYVDY